MTQKAVKMLIVLWYHYLKQRNKMKKVLLSTLTIVAITALHAGGTIEPSISADSIVSESKTEESKDFTISANMAATSNYIWRGMTQTDNSAAIQGGIDLEHSSGLYFGVWGSNISWTNNDKSSLEADFYGGFKTELLGIGFDLGYIQYAYPNVSEESNFGEAYISISKDFDSFGLSAKYSLGIDAPDGADKLDDIEIGATVALPSDFGLSLSYGDYEDVGNRYSAGIEKSIGKFDLSLAYINFSADAGSASDEDNIVFTVSTSF